MQYGCAVITNTHFPDDSQSCSTVFMTEMTVHLYYAYARYVLQLTSSQILT